LALLESGTRFKPVKDLYFGDTNEVRCRRRAKRLYNIIILGSLSRWN